MDASSRPLLRAVETIVVPDREHGQVLVLRDTQGVTSATAVLPPALLPVVSRFNGRAPCAGAAAGGGKGPRQAGPGAGGGRAEVGRCVALGTSAAPMGEPFALCRKSFATPLGEVEVDEERIDALAAAASGFDPYADQFNHKREHSLEFQVVFLKHLLGGRPFKIVPVLAGLGAQQVSGTDPAGEARVAKFMDGVREVVARGAGKVVVVAGADLAHVGPRFGDKAYGEGQRLKVEAKERA